jgi:hypothetical protein
MDSGPAALELTEGNGEGSACMGVYDLMDLLNATRQPVQDLIRIRRKFAVFFPPLHDS